MSGRNVKDASLSSPEPLRPSRGYRFGPFQLDAARRVLLHDGEPVSITPKALDILLFMVRNPGRLLTKDELLEAVWSDTAVEEGNLARNVSTLRAALGEHPTEHRYIVTEFGRGYRFVGAVEELDGSGLVGSSPVADRGSRRTAGASSHARARHRRSVLLLAILALAALAGLGYLSHVRSSAGGAVGIDSLAILPFADPSQTGINGIGEGLAESLVTDLSQEGELRVVSRIVAARYGGWPPDVGEIGRELDVRAVLVGRIERVGDDFLVEAELVDTADVRRLWGRRFSPGEADLVAVERAIVAGIRDQLGLSPPPLGILSGVGTDDAEAYRLFLLGRHEWRRLTPASVHTSLDYYRRALAIDPDYALAYTGIADAYVVLGMGFAHPRESFARAKEAALRALELDDTLAPAHISLGAVHLFHDWDWDAAERAVARARELDRTYRDSIELNTAYGEAYHYYCLYLDVMGRWEEAVAEIRRGLELDPHSPMLGAELAWSYYAGRRFEESAVQARDVLARDPDMWLASAALGIAYVALGRGDDAVAVLARALDGNEDNPSLIADLGHAYGVSGRTEAARQSLAELASMAPDQYVDPYFLALVHAGLGEDDQALESLEAAYADRSPWITWAFVEPRLDRLRGQPRFAELLARVQPATGL